MLKKINIIVVIIIISLSPLNGSNNLIERKDIKELYYQCNLAGVVNYSAFLQSVLGYEKFNFKKKIIAIADFTKSSSEKRFYIISLETKRLLFSSLIAHGKESGDSYVNTYSNVLNSHMSSKGFYFIGDSVVSPKHGVALTLYGLQKGINDNAFKREIIIHGANYVSNEFVNKYGHLGRSLGCPALPIELMPVFTPILANGALLYIYSGSSN